MVRWLGAALATLLTMAGCSKASEEGKAKQWQTSPPAKDVPPAPDLRIDVHVDGAARDPITAARLQATKPDFSDDDRTAWLIKTLVADAEAAGSVVEAVSPAGVSVKFARPTPDGLEPVLFLTRRGEVIVSVIDPKDPFPRYHGQGGRLHRSGDSLPHVGPVARIEITRGSTR